MQAPASVAPHSPRHNMLLLLLCCVASALAATLAPAYEMAALVTGMNTCINGSQACNHRCSGVESCSLQCLRGVTKCFCEVARDSGADVDIDSFQDFVRKRGLCSGQSPVVVCMQQCVGPTRLVDAPCMERCTTPEKVETQMKQDCACFKPSPTPSV